jgi:hypothetical protein
MTSGITDRTGRVRTLRAAATATGAALLLATGALAAVSASPAVAASAATTTTGTTRPVTGTATTTTTTSTTTVATSTITTATGQVVLVEGLEDGVADGWSADSPAEVAVTTEAPNGGSYALAATGLGRVHRSLAGVNLVAGDYYRVNVSAAVAPGSGPARLRLVSGAGPSDSAVLNVPSGGWVGRSYNFRYQPGSPYSDELHFWAESATGCAYPASIRLDNVIVTHLSQPVSLGIEDDFRPCSSGTTSTTRPTTTSTTPAASCELSLQVDHRRPNGFAGTVTVSNTGALDLRSWSATLGLDGGRIVAAGPGVRLTRTDDGVRFDPRANASIRAGRSVSFPVAGQGSGDGGSWSSCTPVAR